MYTFVEEGCVNGIYMFMFVTHICRGRGVRIVYTCDTCVNMCVVHLLSVMIGLLSLGKLIIGICDIQ